MTTLQNVSGEQEVMRLNATSWGEASASLVLTNRRVYRQDHSLGTHAAASIPLDQVSFAGVERKRRWWLLIVAYILANVGFVTIDIWKGVSRGDIWKGVSGTSVFFWLAALFCLVLFFTFFKYRFVVASSGGRLELTGIGVGKAAGEFVAKVEEARLAFLGGTARPSP
ncbi:hypothetical protein [Thermogutta sp.]|uniref:hypothetical protein n=1 Tax=Thermogutta sp. TaxID=1962930 RepID=UPI0032207F65